MGWRGKIRDWVRGYSDEDMKRVLEKMAATPQFGVCPVNRAEFKAALRTGMVHTIKHDGSVQTAVYSEER